jgi:hypothetical protein
MNRRITFTVIGILMVIGESISHADSTGRGYARLRRLLQNIPSGRFTFAVDP